MLFSADVEVEDWIARAIECSLGYVKCPNRLFSEYDWILEVTGKLSGWETKKVFTSLGLSITASIAEENVLSLIKHCPLLPATVILENLDNLDVNIRWHVLREIAISTNFSIALAAVKAFTGYPTLPNMAELELLLSTARDELKPSVVGILRLIGTPSVVPLLISLHLSIPDSDQRDSAAWQALIDLRDLFQARLEKTPVDENVLTQLQGIEGNSVEYVVDLVKSILAQLTTRPEVWGK